jgi:sporulation protein YlmC with PRC-barrel domain
VEVEGNNMKPMDKGTGKIEIEYGASVRDKNGKILGTVNRVLRDIWTGDITKFGVSSELSNADLFYSVEDIANISRKEVKLKVAFGESSPMGIQYGAKVTDRNGKKLGTVDYPVSDTLTGEIKKFKVSTATADDDVFFSIEDVGEATPSEVKLKIAFTK